VDVAAGGRLELLLSGHGGMTTSALAEAANGNRDQILTALRKLESVGRVRRSGQRRSTRWHAITDEERIQKRAAELAARRKTAG
jgi:predicted transcriptional regulator